jgi:hypothetical protein
VRTRTVGLSSSEHRLYRIVHPIGASLPFKGQRSRLASYSAVDSQGFQSRLSFQPRNPGQAVYHPMGYISDPFSTSFAIPLTCTSLTRNRSSNDPGDSFLREDWIISLRDRQKTRGGSRSPSES